MGKTATNLSIVLGVATIAFAGYYMYTQQATSVLDFDSNEQTMQNMLTNTRAFIDYREILDDIELDVSFFDDLRFTTLRGYTTPIEEQSIGRPDPFADVDITKANSL